MIQETATIIKNLKDIKKKTINVFCRTIFLKIGEIDSKSEKFTAEGFTEAYWEDDEIFQQLVQLKSIINSHFKSF